MNQREGGKGGGGERNWGKTKERESDSLKEWTSSPLIHQPGLPAL